MNFSFDTVFKYDTKISKIEESVFLGWLSVLLGILDYRNQNTVCAKPSYLCSVGYGVKLILIWKKMEYISGPQCVVVNMCKCNTKLGYESVS